MWTQSMQRDVSHILELVVAEAAVGEGVADAGAARQGWESIALAQRIIVI